MDKELREALQVKMEVAKKAAAEFIEQGKVAPSMLIVSYLGETRVINVSDMPKDFVELLFVGFKHTVTVSVIMLVVEAWVVEKLITGEDLQKMLETGPSILPSNDPSRKEMLMFITETRGGDLVGRALITRPAEGPPVVGPVKLMNMSKAQIMGRFVGKS